MTLPSLKKKGVISSSFLQPRISMLFVLVSAAFRALYILQKKKKYFGKLIIFCLETKSK